MGEGLRELEVADELRLLAQVHDLLILLLFALVIVGCLSYLSCKIIPHGTNATPRVDRIVHRREVRFCTDSRRAARLRHRRRLLLLELRLEHPGGVRGKVNRFRDGAMLVDDITTGFYPSDVICGPIL